MCFDVNRLFVGECLIAHMRMICRIDIISENVRIHSGRDTSMILIISFDCSQRHFNSRGISAEDSKNNLPIN